MFSAKKIKYVFCPALFLHRGNQTRRVQKRTVMLKRQNRRPQLMAVMTPPTTAMESRRKWSRRRVDRLAVSSKKGLTIRNVRWPGASVKDALDSGHKLSLLHQS